MKILGIDPGSRKTGFALLDIQGQKISILEIGVWELNLENREASLGLRLEKLYSCTKELLKKSNPHVIGFEKAISFKSVPSALILSEARGVIRLAIHEILDNAEQRIIELSPTEIKKKSTGSGAATKDGVKRVLSLRFPTLKEIAAKGNFSHDAFDALAVAWTAWIVHKEQYGRKIGASVRP